MTSYKNWCDSLALAEKRGWILKGVEEESGELFFNEDRFFWVGGDRYITAHYHSNYANRPGEPNAWDVYTALYI